MGDCAVYDSGGEVCGDSAGGLSGIEAGKSYYGADQYYGICPSLFAIGTALNIYMLGGGLFCFGVFWNLCDISLNTQGIGIERLYGRTIMASFHGGWSLAACLGALIGFIMIVSDVTPFWHFTLIAALILLLTMVSSRYLQDDVSTAEAVEDKSEKWQYIKRPEMLLIKLGWSVCRFGG